MTDWTHGLIAIASHDATERDPLFNVNVDGVVYGVYHVCLYPSVPTKVDIDELKKELVEDDDFAFDFDFKLAHATQEILDTLLPMVADCDDDDE